MAQLPITSFFAFNGAPYIGEKDAGGTNVVPSLVYVKNGSGGFVPVSATDPVPMSVMGSNLRQILVAPPALDFKGKTAGQTFDVPHVHKIRTTVATFDAPGTAGFAEPATTSYNLIATQDGTSSATAAAANTNYAQQLFSFDFLNALKIAGYIPQSWDVATLTARLKSLVVTWVGFGVGSNAGVSTNGATVKAWNTLTTAWTDVMTNTSAIPSSATYAPTGAGMTNKIDQTTGFIHILAHSTYPSDGTIASTVNTDYIKVDVQFYGDYLQNGDALSQGKPGSPVPMMAQQIAGNKGGNAAVPAVAAAADGMSASLDGVVTTAVMMGSNGATRDVTRLANKQARAAFTAATSVVIAAPGATKKLNPQGPIVIAGITAGEMVDLRDGGIAGTIVKSKSADAQGNVEFYYPEGGTSGRLAAVNNTLAATWTTAKTGSASVAYNEE